MSALEVNFLLGALHEKCIIVFQGLGCSELKKLCVRIFASFPIVIPQLLSYHQNCMLIVKYLLLRTQEEKYSPSIQTETFMCIKVRYESRQLNEHKLLLLPFKAQIFLWLHCNAAAMIFRSPISG